MIEPISEVNDASANSKNHNEVDATLVAMLQQEASCYSNRTFENRSSTSLPRLEEEDGITQATAATFQRSVAVLGDIFDLCRLQHRETLVIAASYLARFLSSTRATPPTTVPTTEQNLSLVALVCFYMAVKVHEPAAIPLRSVSDLYERFFPLSNGDVEVREDATSAASEEELTVHRLEQIELEICHVLHWRLHPPTPLGFARRLQPDDDDRLLQSVQVCLEQAFSANAWSYCHDFQASTLAEAARLVVGENKMKDNKQLSFLSKDTVELRRAMAFLRNRRPTSTDEITTLTTITPSTTTKTTRQNNKRCVSPLPPSPPPSSSSTKLHKRRRKHGSNPWTSNKVSLSSPMSSSLRSPRSALSVASDEQTS